MDENKPNLELSGDMARIVFRRIGMPKPEVEFQKYFVDASVGSAAISNYIYVDYVHFRKQAEELKNCLTRLEGAVEFYDSEDSLQVKIEFEGGGRAGVSARLAAGSPHYAEVQFSFGTDQTYLSSFCDQMIDEFDAVRNLARDMDSI